MAGLRLRLRSTAWLAGAMVAALLASVAWGPIAAAAEQSEGETAIATFEGEEVPMDEVWDMAEACAMWEDGSIECFRTKEQREEAERERSSVSGDGFTVASSSSCPVRLYALTGYAGAELSLHTRFKWHNLRDYGFSNRTSSYKISGCSSTFRSGAYGSGSTYPGMTYAWTWSSSMAYGWDDRISSVWIH